MVRHMAALFVLVAVSFASVTAVAQLEAGDKAKAFYFDNINPLAKVEDVRLKDFKKDDAVKLIVVNFSAKFCKPCKEEMKLLKELYEKHHGAGLEVVTISIDKVEDVPELVEYLEQEKIPYPVLIDKITKNNKVARKYLGETMTIPAIFVISPKLKILKRFQGLDEAFIPYVESVFQEPPGAD